MGKRPLEAPSFRFYEEAKLSPICPLHPSYCSPFGFFPVSRRHVIAGCFRGPNSHNLNFENFCMNDCTGWSAALSDTSSLWHVASVCGILCWFRAPRRLRSLETRWFSTRRKTAKAIQDLRLRQEAQRQEFQLQEKLEKGLLPLNSATNNFLPKYAKDPLALTPPPSPPALFDRIRLSPPVATRRSPPPELQHGPPQRPLGRVSALKSTELAAAVLTCAQKHRENPSLWLELNAACLRRGPHLGAAEAALVLHGYASAGLRVLPVLQSCVDTLLCKWNDARLVDVARALHSLLGTFGVRDLRLLRRCIDTFGPLLRRRYNEMLKGIPPQDTVQHLHTLALLLKAFAAVQLPYPPLLSTATEALRAQLQLALPRQQLRARLSRKGSSLKERHADPIFSLPSFDAFRGAADGPLHADRLGATALQPSLILSILESLSSLGVRHEPLFHALDSFLVATVPTANTNPAGSAAKAPTVLVEASRLSVSLATKAAAAYWGAPPYRYSMRRGETLRFPLVPQSGWLKARGHFLSPPEGQKALVAAAAISAAARPTGAPSPASWSLRHLSRAVKYLGLVGCRNPQLMAAWVAALRHCGHRCSPEDLLLALEAARLSAFFSRPLLLMVMGSFAHLAGDSSLPIGKETLLSAAAAAAQLPVALASFWRVVGLSLLGLTGDDPGGAVSFLLKADECKGLRRLSPAAPKLPLGSPTIPASPGRTPKPPEPLSVSLAVALLEAVALAEPVLPMQLAYPALAALLPLQREALSLAVSLRVLGMIRLLRLKADTPVPDFLIGAAARKRRQKRDNCAAAAAAAAAALAEAGEIVWGRVRLQVECLLRRQQPGLLLQYGDTGGDREGEREGASWMALLEGPLSGDGQLLELCVAAVFSEGDARCKRDEESLPVSEGLSFEAETTRRSYFVRCCAWDILQHVRRLVAPRRSSCPLVFGCLEEAVGLLQLELLPYCREEGLAVAATRLLPSYRNVASPQQQRGQAGSQQRLPRQPAGLNRFLRETPAEQELGHTSEGLIGLNVLRPSLSCQRQTRHKDEYMWAPDGETLEVIVSCFSSRLVTGSTATLFHALTLTLRALLHPYWQALLRQLLLPVCNTGLARPPEDGLVGDRLPVGDDRRGREKSASPPPSRPPLDDPLRPPGSWQEGRGTSRKGEEAAELLCSICLLSLEAIQQRIDSLQANELALLAADVQTLLASLEANAEALPPAASQQSLQSPQQPCQQQKLRKLHPQQPKEDSEKLGLGLTVDKGGPSAGGPHEEAASTQQLVRGLAAVLEAVARRWLSVPATVSSTGSTSSLNVWLCLRGHAGGEAEALQRALLSALGRGDPQTGGEIKETKIFLEEIRRKAFLEALCPASYNREALRWLQCLSVGAEISSDLHCWGGLPAASSCVKSTHAKVACPAKAANAKHEQHNSWGCGGHQHSSACHGAEDSFAEVGGMRHWLRELSFLHSATDEPPCMQGASAAARGLLTLSRHRKLALMWLSQLMRAHV